NHLSQANAISLMVDAYFESREEEHTLLKQTLSSLLDEKLSFMKEKMNRIQIASTVIDRDTKIILMILNHYYLDRKSTRLNSSYVSISYAVFCLKKKKIHHIKS